MQTNLETCIVNELNKFVYDILAQRILAGLSKLKP